MLPSGGSFRGSRGACFAQILMKNLPVSPGQTQSSEPLPSPPSKDVLSRDVLNKEVKSKYGGPNKPKVTIKMMIDKYNKGELNAVSLLHQLAQILQFHLEVKETVTTGNTLGLYFAFCMVIDGVEYKTGMGLTKKDARLQAAKLALEDLLPTFGSLKSVLPAASGPPPLLSVKQEPSLSDVHSCRSISERKNSAHLQVLQAVKHQLTNLLHTSEFSVCARTTAAFIIQTSSRCEVVALGTGNFNTKESASLNGRIVHDSHAVVTARRSLMRFLYRNLLMFFSKNADLMEKSVFQQNSNGGLLSLKKGITLHLYVNQLPNGAAQIPSKLCLSPLSLSAWQVNSEISLHLTVEGKVFSVFSSPSELCASRMVSMSTTDKITQWQVLGYQGALLSHFIEPVYVQSILIGDSGSIDIRGMEMSVSQRTEGITPQLPMFYCMSRPHISLVPPVATYSGGSQLTYGINWCEGDCSFEVVDGLEGRTTEKSPFKSGSALASRLCKAAMLHRFKLVAKEAQMQDLLATKSYREAKRMAKPYQEAKNVLRAYLLQRGFGSWLVKLSVSDNFNM